MTLAPRLDALPPPQRALWPQLVAVPRRYVLYGGTALALRLAHRPSIDFDFFAHDHLDHHELETVVPFVRDAAVLDEGPDTRTILVTSTGLTSEIDSWLPPDVMSYRRRSACVPRAWIDLRDHGEGQPRRRAHAPGP